MPQDDITRIRVNNSTVGIIGLKNSLGEMEEEYRDRSDTEVTEELLNRLGKRNYIPEKVKGDYGCAFFREFQKFLGRPFEEESPKGIEIKILGPGCAQCDRLEQELMQVVAETGVIADVEHVRDIKEIGKYGVMGMPALIINGKVKSVGKVPSRNNLTTLLKEIKRQ